MTRERQDARLLKDALETLAQVSAQLQHYQEIQESTFSRWLRRQPELNSGNPGFLSIMDLDWIIHQYKDTADSNGETRVENIMLVEEKRQGEKMRFAQADTFSTLAEILKSKHRKKKVLTIPIDKTCGRVRVRFFGCHVLTFSSDGPEDSKRILWNDFPVDLRMLQELLLFYRNPWNPEKTRGDRRHHRNIKQGDLPLYATEEETDELGF